MRDVVSVCEIPVIVLLLAGIVIIVVCIGSLVGEFLTEHRHFKVFLPKIVDELERSESDPSVDPVAVIKGSGLLLRQKRYLIELLNHPDLTDEMRESLAVGIENEERRRYDIKVKVTEVISRIAPLVGLLGTLIPLGPGIMALGEGNTEILSASLLTAFDTISLGLIIAAFAIVITAIRKRWYKDYMVTFDALMECVLDIEKDRNRRGGARGTERCATFGGTTAINERLAQEIGVPMEVPATGKEDER